MRINLKKNQKNNENNENNGENKTLCYKSDYYLLFQSRYGKVSL
jgi:hypothetical protein